MTPEQLDRLEQLAREATPGPWRFDERVGTVAVYPGDPQDCLAAPHERFVHSKQGTWVDDHWTVDERDTADAAYIAALSPAVVSELVAAARLGAAWQEAEAALPEGWALHKGPWLAKHADPARREWVAEARWWSGPIGEYGAPENIAGRYAHGIGPTPAAALLALAEALRERGT